MKRTKENDQPTVFVIDDDQAICAAIEWLFQTVKLPVKTFFDAKSYLTIHQNDHPGCLLIDIRMPGMSGLELQQRLKELGNRIPIIFITGHGDVPMAVRALKAGAVDFILKPFNNQQLLEQVQQAIAQNTQEHQSRDHLNGLSQLLATLTPREREVMYLIVKGKLNKEVCHELNIAISTVELHRSHVMQKMQATSLAQLVKMHLTLDAASLLD